MITGYERYATPPKKEEFRLTKFLSTQNSTPTIDEQDNRDPKETYELAVEKLDFKKAMNQVEHYSEDSLEAMKTGVVEQKLRQTACFGGQEEDKQDDIDSLDECPSNSRVEIFDYSFGD